MLHRQSLIILTLVACSSLMTGCMTWRCLDGDCSSEQGRLIDNVHGHIYTGQLKDGLPSGEGTLVYGSGLPGYTSSWNDGDIYTGKWVNSRGRYYRHGPGRFTDVRVQIIKSGTFYFDSLVLSPGSIEAIGGPTVEGFWVNDRLLLGDCARNAEKAVADGLTPGDVLGLTSADKRRSLAGYLEGRCEAWGPSGKTQADFDRGQLVSPGRKRPLH